MVFIATQIYADATAIADVLALLPTDENPGWAARLIVPAIGDLNDLLRQLECG